MLRISTSPARVAHGRGFNAPQALPRRGDVRRHGAASRRTRARRADPRYSPRRRRRRNHRRPGARRTPAALHPTLQAGPLDSALAAALTFADLPTSPSNPPLLFCGPPGAGKTLTVARLATRLVLAGGAPLIITTDGKRAGATEQLAAFTKLLGINLIVACHPVTLGRALARRGDAAPVLIDTAGSNPFDPTDSEELAALATTAGAAPVLVLPGGMDTAESADLAAAYATTGATAMVATRLDLTRRLGSILAAASVGHLALTEAGIGPGAADGLVPLTPAFLAERLMQTRMVPP